MSLLDEEKKFYERFWALLRDKQLMQVFERYGPTAFRRSSVLEGFESFIQEHGFRGATCVEIGTLKGLTALVLARYFEVVVTIDIVDDPEKREIAAMLGVDNIVFVNVKDNAEKQKILLAHRFDAAYVDGDHARDTETDFAAVAKCGRVLFHEAWEVQPPVMRLIDRLRDSGRVVTKDKWALWIA